MFMDQRNEQFPAQTINPTAHTATITGSGVDLKGYQGATVHIGVGTWTDGKWVCTLQESDDDVTYAAVDSGDIIGTMPTISGRSNVAYDPIGYKGIKRYIRVLGTGTGAATGALFGAIIVRGFKRHNAGN